MLLAAVFQWARNQATGFVFSKDSSVSHKDRSLIKPLEEISRRSAFQAILIVPFLAGLSEKVNAEEAKRPYAPVEDLLPAMRVKVFIDRSYQLAKELTTSDNPQVQAKIMDDLQSLLLEPQKFTRGYQLKPVPVEPAKQYLDTYKKNREQMSLLEQPGAFFVQNGEMDTWRRLKRRERTLEEQDEIRAALNAYTTALSFSADSYLLNNQSKEERSKMIREDRLPDIKQVIQADMGRRYLYRNQILTTVEDLRAELTYQLKNKDGTASTTSNDPTELLDLAKEAKAACDQWFSLIDDSDIAEAVSVLKEDDRK